MKQRPRLQIITLNQPPVEGNDRRVTSWDVHIKHHAEVKKYMIDKAAGAAFGLLYFREFDTVYGDGKVGLFMADIVEYMLITESYCEEYDAARKEDELDL